ncbi:MAG: AAA family ATPase [Gammaproteobacteria bacterium]|nr:AAA family ATPase [Gammaproteobacteria bacterium]
MYSDYFSFEFHPFSPTVDKRIFYPSTVITQSMAILQHSLLDGDRLLVLTGPAGTGKTCLITKLVSELSPQVRHEYLLADDFTDVELLQSMALEFDLNASQDSRVALFKAITRELRNISSRGQKILLVIDNAHLLGAQALRAIDKLVDGQSAGDYSLSVLLSGRTDLPRNLVKEFGSVRDQRFRMIAALQSMSQVDTHGYINHRLMKAGVNEQAIFSKDVIKTIYGLTQGVPRRINVLCDIALLNAFSKQSTTVGQAHVEQALRKLGWSARRREPSAKGVTPIARDNGKGNKVSVKDVTGNSVSYSLNGDVVKIGRAPDCDIRIDEINISRYQAEIIPEDSGYIIKSHGSTTPVMLNASSVKSAQLKDGDVVSIGNYVLHFELPASNDAGSEGVRAAGIN